MQYYSRFCAVFVFHVRPFSYYLVRPGQQSMQYCSSQGVSVFDETRPFQLVGPDQQPTQYCSSVEGASICLLLDQVLLLHDGTNNHYLRPGFNLVINPYNLALFPTTSLDKAFLVLVMQFAIGRMIKRRQNIITVYRID